MFSKICLSKENLLFNLRYLRQLSGGKLCFMVKANAYGHGAIEIVKMSEEEVDYYGVSCQNEALEIRAISSKPIIVFGKCEDYVKCVQNNISFALLSYRDCKSITKKCIKKGLVPRFHLCVNSGMNRYGVKDIKQYLKILEYLSKHNLQLEGIYTHFSSLTSSEKYTDRQNKIFKEFLSFLPQDWDTIVHVGGGKSIFKGIKADMYRVGLEAYGYGEKLVKKVLAVKSTIVDIQKVNKGEYVGYLCSYLAEKDMRVATIPLGYGDGIFRNLSNSMTVTINGKKCKNVGNICMDAFMVDVTKVKCEEGDEVLIFDDAAYLAGLAKTTEYEILTALTKFRGERKII